jgi:hypothetical protein
MMMMTTSRSISNATMRAMTVTTMLTGNAVMMDAGVAAEQAAAACEVSVDAFHIGIGRSLT